MKQISNAQFGKVERNLQVITVVECILSGSIFRISSNKTSNKFYLQHFEKGSCKFYTRSTTSVYRTDIYREFAEYIYTELNKKRFKKSKYTLKRTYNSLSDITSDILNCFDDVICFDGFNVYTTKQ